MKCQRVVYTRKLASASNVVFSSNHLFLPVIALSRLTDFQEDHHKHQNINWATKKTAKHPSNHRFLSLKKKSPTFPTFHPTTHHPNHPNQPGDRSVKTACIRGFFSSIFTFPQLHDQRVDPHRLSHGWKLDDDPWSYCFLLGKVCLI